MIIYLVFAGLLVGLDQLVKAWVVAHIAVNHTVAFLPGLALTHLQNDGAAFSMLRGQQWFFYLITAVSLVVVYWLWRDAGRNRFYKVGLTLIVAGTLGNFIDRLRLGYVTDMFETTFMNFAIFNVADACLTIGVVFVVIYLLFMDGKGEQSR
ncbi:signal peptidase II [Lacticaseibacillus jixianensis]|uniref:Lipoprotein signal peptidase n=1 Tax=Lacticaseibacillus jixianensis TaxID=2486012 RepID=A0ABW4B5A5_9LACO|nr:signal peptidase II [Lacticaseibacillus jixianensis]